MLAFDPGEVDLRVDQGRVLPLGICALAAEGGEAGDARGGQAACDGGIRGQTGDSNGVVANGQRELASLGAREAEAGINDFVRTKQTRVPKSHLLIENTDRAVGLAVKGEREGRIVHTGLLAVADAREPGVVGILLIVKAQVALVRVDSEGSLLRVTVGCKTRARQAALRQARNLLEEADDLLRNRIDGTGGNRGAGSIGCTGDRVSYWNDEHAVELVLSGQGEDAERLERLTEAFVVDEVEELVLENRSAEVHTELVAIEGGFLKGNNISGAADGGRFEVAGCVEVGIADELVDCSVKAIRSTGGRDVDGSA